MKAWASCVVTPLSAAAGTNVELSVTGRWRSLDEQVVFLVFVQAVVSNKKGSLLYLTVVWPPVLPVMLRHQSHSNLLLVAVVLLPAAAAVCHRAQYVHG